MRPYSVRAPEFDVTSGGIRVIHGLHAWLLAKGQISYLNARYENPDFVAIYPEIYKGNDLGGKTVVRYLLNKPGVMGARMPDGSFESGQTEFDKTDLIYAFSRLFWETDADHYLFLPILNMHLFKDQKKIRTKKAVFYGKGQDLGLHPDGCYPIDRKLASDQQHLADLLNECEVMYCYDPVTAMTEIARLCGCRVVIFPSTYTKEQFKNYEPGMNGISWGEDDHTKLDTEAFTGHYRGLWHIFSDGLDRFIEVTQHANN